MADSIKLCKDCKFFKRSLLDYLPPFDFNHNFSRCSHPNSIIVNPVNGRKKLGYTSLERMHRFGSCGQEGWYWEAK